MAKLPGHTRGALDDPPGLDPEAHRVRSASFILPASESLREAVAYEADTAPFLAQAAT